MCILFVYTLLKVVKYYDFEYFVFECLGFQKTSLDGGWMGGVSSIQVLFGLLECFLLCKAPKGNQVIGMIRSHITYKDKSFIVPLYKGDMWTCPAFQACITCHICIHL